MANDLSRAWPALPEALDLSITDNHTHLDFTAEMAGKNDTDLPLADGVVAASPEHFIALAAKVNVTQLLEVGCDIPSARRAVELAQLPGVLAGIAIHPNEAPKLAAQPGRGGGSGLDDAIAEIAELSRDPRVRVIGETGIDTFRTGPEGLADQVSSFRSHIALAKERDLVLQIHDRDAHAEVIATLESDGAPRRTVFHCFSGDLEMAKLAVERGWYLSIAGTVSFKNARTLQEAVAWAPLEQILVETDAPYLTAQPYRGRPNASYLIPLTVRAIADLKDCSVDDVCRAVQRNSEELYGPW